MAAGIAANFLIHSVRKPGRPLFAGQLGHVELTIALHYVVQHPDDRLVWDVGTPGVFRHKGADGPARAAGTPLSQEGWACPYPTRSEERIRHFSASGPSSTSIRRGVGPWAVRGRRNAAKNQASCGHYRRMGGVTARMAFEALNHAGSLPADLLIVLKTEQNRYVDSENNCRALSQLFWRGRRLLRADVLQLEPRAQKRCYGPNAHCVGYWRAAPKENI